MSSHLAKGAPFKLVQRSLASQPAAAVANTNVAAANPIPDVKVSVLPNGLTVASVDCPVPVSTVAVMVKAGSRYETYDNAGITQVMKNMAGAGGKNHSSFGIIRNIQQQGGNLDVSYNRENLTYATTTVANRIDGAMDYLVEAVCNPAFKPWEVRDLLYRLDADAEVRLPCQVAADLLNKAAFRDGLGNSLVAPDYMRGKHNPALLQAYFNQNYTSNRATIVGYGMDHEQLSMYANMIQLDKGAGVVNKSKYYGGELRKDAGGKKAYVNLAGETAAATNFKEHAATQALRVILGNPKMPYSSGAGKLAKAVAGMDGVKVEVYGADYSDTGLTGASIQASAANAGKAVSAVAAALRSLTVTDKEVAAAKNTLRNLSYDRMMSRNTCISDIGSMALAGKEVLPASKIDGLIDGITVGDVQAVAKKLSSSKLSMGSMGNLGTVPYLDTL